MTELSSKMVKKKRKEKEKKISHSCSIRKFHVLRLKFHIFHFAVLPVFDGVTDEVKVATFNIR